MLFVLFTLLVASFLSRLNIVWAVDSSPPSLLSRADSDIQVLTAITFRSEVERRGIDFTPKYTLEHHYADRIYSSVMEITIIVTGSLLDVSLLRNASARFAKTSTRFKIPALALEEIESHLEDIECYHSLIVLKFVDEVALSQAKGQWGGLSKFIVISSHPGCNVDGQRAPYLVSEVKYSANEATAVLLAYRIEWRAAYAFVKVEFGMTDKSPGSQYSISDVRSHENIHLSLGRRLALASTAGQTTTSSTSAQAATSSTIIYPLAPTSTPSSESSVQNISFYPIDQPSIISWNDRQNNIGCKKCSLTSSVEITHGTFIINGSTINDFEKSCQLGEVCRVIEEAYQFVESGFFNVVVNGFSAHVELNNSILVSTSQFFSQDIFTVGLPGFQIPDIAVVGPQYNAAIVGSVDIVSEVNFTYGFDLKIPDGSSINIDIGNLTNSTQQGFSNITATPFSASTDNTNLGLTIGLRSAVLLGVNALAGAGSIYAGIFLDLPSLSANISSLKGVNAHCDPLTFSKTASGLLSHVFPKLTNIVPSVNIGFGLEAGAGLDIAHLNVNTQSKTTSTTLAGTTFPLQTACLSWDEQATKFVEPTFTTTSTTSTTSAAGATGTGSQSDGQKAGSTDGGNRNFGIGLRDRNPFAQTIGTAWAMGMALGCILLSVAAL